MEAKKISIGDEIYYLDSYREQVLTGEVSTFDYTANDRIQKVRIQDNYYGSPKPHLVLGKVIPLEEGEG